MQYIIRKASNQDVSQVSKLIFDIWINEYNFKVVSEDYPDLQNIEQYYHQKRGDFLVLINDDNEIVGTVAYDFLSDNIFILKRMFVKNNFRGRGIAQMLLDKLFQSFTEGTTFYLSTKEDQAIAAKKFYLRNGFHVISKDELPQKFPFFYEDNLFMKKEIL